MVMEECPEKLEPSVTAKLEAIPEGAEKPPTESPTQSVEAEQCKVEAAKAVPGWLQVLLGVVTLFEKKYAWLAPAIEILYQAFQLLPWFHKPKALKDMHHAVCEAKKMDSPEPIHDLAKKMSDGNLYA